MKKDISRLLRQRQTPWELKLWQILRNRQINNLKFRRQFKIGKYIVDFCCLEKKLIIELDGGQHVLSDNIELDKIRQQLLENFGYKVIRFYNNEIDDNLEGVIDQIISFVTSPQPSPKREREN